MGQCSLSSYVQEVGVGELKVGDLRQFLKKNGLSPVGSKKILKESI